MTTTPPNHTNTDAEAATAPQMDPATAAAAAAACNKRAATPFSQLPWLDKLLTLWILLAMILGVLLGNYVPSAAPALNSGKIADVSIPIFVGLLWMMYPVLCKVRYEELGSFFKSKKIIHNLVFSLVVNVVVAPLLMTALAWATLPDLPNHRAGVILVGVARCIAMVLIWCNLAGGDMEWCAILVAFNSILQLFLFSPVAYFLCVIVGKGSSVNVDLWLVTKSVLIFLGIPLVAAIITRFTLRFGLKKRFGPKWYDEKFVPVIGTTTLIALLFTIVVMFTLQGKSVISDIPNVLRVAVPLILYFSLIFFLTFFASLHLLQMPHSVATTQAFTASGNNFELAIAVAIASYGIESSEALATVVGPLIEVPVLLLMVNVALWLKGPYDRALERLMKRQADESLEKRDGLSLKMEENTPASMRQTDSTVTRVEENGFMSSTTA
ncbi:hypothetical protein HDV05_003519 [Chytridiales sp. JEL 0842]|nr:hypothetical protein HDV05_003519 [Chytridiales sp. JEL 0842]